MKNFENETLSQKEMKKVKGGTVAIVYYLFNLWRSYNTAPAGPMDDSAIGE